MSKYSTASSSSQLPLYRSRLEALLSLAAAHSDASHKCALPSCGFIGHQLVEVRRLGRQEIHNEWDTRDEVRPLLEQVVKNVFGPEGAKRDSLNTLLADQEIVNALEQAKNVMKAENRDAGPGDLPKVYRLLGNFRYGFLIPSICLLSSHSLRAGAFSAAFQFYSRAIASDPWESMVFSDRASCHYRMGQYALCVQVKTGLDDELL